MLVRLLTSSFALALVFQSCKEEIEPANHYIQEPYRSYIDFKPGSFWVYEDSLSGDIDSVFVTYHQSEMQPWSAKPDKVYGYTEILMVNWHSQHYDRDEKASTYFYCAPPPPVYTYAGCQTTQLSYLLDGEWVPSRDEICKYPFKMGAYFPSSYNYCYVTGIYDAYAMNGTIFLNVCRTSWIKSSASGPDTVANFYMAQDAGLIRREQADSTGWRVWKLKRYHAVR